MVLRAKAERKEEKDRTREELLRAALRLGAVHGFASLGLREVAREASIAPTSFYRHFEDMEALGLSLIRDKVEPLVGLWSKALRPTEGEPVELVDALFRSVDDDPELARFLVTERVGASTAFRSALRDVLSQLAEPLLAGLSQGKRTDALVEAADLVTVLLLEAAAQLLDCSTEDRPRLRQRMLKHLAYALAAVHAEGPQS